MAIAEAGRRRRQPRFPLKLAIIGGAVCCAAAGFQITASSKKGGSGNVYPSEPSLRPPAITPLPSNCNILNIEMSAEVLSGEGSGE